MDCIPGLKVLVLGLGSKLPLALPPSYLVWLGAGRAGSSCNTGVWYVMAFIRGVCSADIGQMNREKVGLGIMAFRSCGW